jgi:nucleotide-binding universal stress UspA family protein
MKRILAAVDGSDHALKGVDLAADLAAKDDAELTLLAVVSETARLDEGLDAYTRVEHIREPGARLALAAADNILACARDRAAAKGAKRITVEADLGDPATRIVDAARARKADAIVVGSRGHGRLTGLFVGSVAQKVLSLAPCSVIVAR